MDVILSTRTAGILCVLAFSLAASAATARASDPPFLAGGMGYYDIDDTVDATEFRIEYRGRKLLWALKPVLGVMATSDGAVYGYGGLAVDILLGRHWVVTPSLAAGAYHDGDGKDLGYTVLFRSALELAYRFDNRSRLGLMFYHLSNASLGDENPGTEVLSVTYSIPLN